MKKNKGYKNQPQKEINQIKSLPIQQQPNNNYPCPYQIKSTFPKTFKLYNNPFQTIQINIKTNTVKCIQNDQDATVVRTIQPIDINNIVSYFQAKIIDFLQNQPHRIYVGFIQKNTNLRKYPGTTLNTIGFSGNIIHFLAKDINQNSTLKINKVNNDNIVKKNTVLGIGINTYLKSIFFTFDGVMLPQQIPLSNYSQWNQFYPCVCVTKQKDQIKFIFNINNFKFDVKNYIKQQKQKIAKQINQVDCIISSSSNIMTTLVDQYLLFHGYSKTLTKLRQKRKQSYNSNFIQFSKTLYNQPGIKIVKKINQQIEQNNVSINGCKKNLKIQNFLSQSKKQQQQLKNVSQKSQDSDLKYLVDEISIQRKKTYAKQQEFLSLPEQLLGRKYSDTKHQLTSKKNKRQPSIIRQYEQSEIQIPLSNISNQSDSYIQFQIYSKEKEEAYKLLPQILQFLQKDRLDILACIKDEKIQQATKIIREAIPQLLQSQPYLQAFLKGHIFIRKIKRENPLSAVRYAKQQKCFLKYQNNLFPVYNSQQGNGLNWIPMKQIFTLLGGALNKNSKNNKEGWMSQMQFQKFSEYMNKIILKKLGFHDYSRLQTCLNHIVELNQISANMNIISPKLTIKNSD